MRGTGPPVFSWTLLTAPGSIRPAVSRGRLSAGDHPDHPHHHADRADHANHANHANHADHANDT